MDRMLRVNELLKRELGETFERILRGRVNGLVTVTKIKTAPDLRHALVFISVYGGQEQDKQNVLNILKQERNEIQHQMSTHVRLKYTPKLEFRIDEVLEEADRVMQLLEHLPPPSDQAEGAN